MPDTQAALAHLIAAAGIADRRLIAAFHAIPRAEFVPEGQRDLAYRDQPIPIAHGQVTTQPSLSAMMIEALDLAPTRRVLEVGTGLGFQTALLAHLSSRVVTIEMWEDLALQAQTNLEGRGISNVEFHVGDGTLGVPDAAPFDAILVSAAFPEVPDPLKDQLVDRGRLVQPIGSGGNEMVTVFGKTGDHLETIRPIIPARFVRLVGREAFPAEGVET